MIGPSVASSRLRLSSRAVSATARAETVERAWRGASCRVPTVSAGVRQGMSSSLRRSVSSFMSVIEAPAISSEVAYSPTHE